MGYYNLVFISVAWPINSVRYDNVALPRVTAATRVKTWSLSQALGRHSPPEELQCSLAVILWDSTGGTGTILPKHPPSYGVLMKVVENAV